MTNTCWKNYQACCVCLLAALLIAWAPSIGLAQPVKKNSPRLDAYGDPLPDGAAARLGTLRFVHPGGVASVAISPNGKLVASGGLSANQFHRKKNLGKPSEGLICLWEPNTGKLIRQITTPWHPVSQVSFTPDGKNLVCFCGDAGRGSVCLWNVATGRLVWKTPSVENNLADRFRFANGNRLISVHDRTTKYVYETKGAEFSIALAHEVVRLWNLSTGNSIEQKEYLKIPNMQRNANPALFQPAAAHSRDGRFTALSIHSGTLKNPVHGLTFFDFRVEVFDNSRKTRHLAIGGFSAPVTNLEFSPDGKTLAAATRAKLWLIRIKDRKKRLLVAALPYALGCLNFVSKNQIFTAPDRFTWGSAHLWSVATGKEQARYSLGKAVFGDVAIGKQLIATNRGCVIFLQDATTRKQLVAFPLHRNEPEAFYFRSPRTLCSWGDKDCEWDLRTGELRKSYRFPVPYTPNLNFLEVCHAKQLYVGYTDKGILEFRNLRTKKRVRVLKGRINPHHQYSALFSSTGNTLLIAEQVKEKEILHFYRVSSGKKMSQPTIALRVNNSDLRAVNDRLAAIPQTNGQILLADVRAGRIIHRLFAEPREWLATCHQMIPRFSSDGRFLFALASDVDRGKSFMLVWSVNTGKQAHKVEMHHPPGDELWEVMGLAWSPDMRLLALSREKTCIEIWDIASGLQRGSLSGHLDEVTGLVFSPQGKHLASGSLDTSILIWDLYSPLQPAKFKKHLIQKDLTTHWQTLAQADAKNAGTAIWSMIYAPKDSIPFLKKHLRRISPPDAKLVHKWLGDLESDKFKVRTKATREIEKLGELAIPALQKSLAKKNSLEKHLRLTALLKEAEKANLPFGTPERLRQWRALEVLEKIGSVDAKAVLRNLANGAAGARLTKEAQACLNRMK